jgi:hypothetical protein
MAHFAPPVGPPLGSRDRCTTSSTGVGRILRGVANAIDRDGRRRPSAAGVLLGTSVRVAIFCVLCCPIVHYDTSSCVLVQGV